MEPEKSLEDGKIHKDNPAATGLSLSGEELERILKTGTGGLSEEEVRSRLQEYGFNDIPEEKKHPLLRFLRYFWGPIPWMIEVAALLSAIIQHWEDFGIIFLMLVINAVVGFFQERKAENAIELLKQRLAPNARVLRDGVWTEIPARGLVPGDIVHIRLGDIVPEMSGSRMGSTFFSMNPLLQVNRCRLRKRTVTMRIPDPLSGRERWMRS